MEEAREEPFYTVPQAARLLHVSAVTIWRWVAARKLPAYRVGPRNIRIRRADLETMVKPADVSEVIMRKETTPSLEPPTPAELARRKSLVAQILSRRRQRVITPITAADLVHKAREEKGRSHDQ